MDDCEEDKTETLIFLDEADSIDPQIWDALESALLDGPQKIFALSNPQKKAKGDVDGQLLD